MKQLCVTALMLAALVIAAVARQPQPRVAGQEPSVRMIADEGEAARHWPRWRGPSGQGLAAGTGYVDRWSATENVIWKTPLPGSGNSVARRGDGERLQIGRASCRERVSKQV